MTNVLIVGSSVFSIINFRSDLVKQLQKKNKVTILCLAANEKEMEYFNNELKVNYYPLNFSRNNFSFLSDLKTFLMLRKIIKNHKPNTIFSFNVKPTILTGITLLFFNIKKISFIPTITGLGTGLHGKTLKRKLIRIVLLILYYFSLIKTKKVVFQNIDNKKFFLRYNLINSNKCIIIPGSGVNTDKFKYTKIAPFPIKFLMISRLTNEKGVIEFYKAAKIVYKIYPEVKFQLIGSKERSIDRISDANIELIENNNFINYLRFSSDIYGLISSCHVFVLPSYHEGMPMSVLEALSVGRAIITTNADGCRDTVIDNINGFCISVKNVDELVSKMIWFIKNTDKIEKMGLESRKIVTKKFDIITINNLYMELV